MCCSVSFSAFTDYSARKTNWTSSVVSCKNHDNSSVWGVAFDRGLQNLVRVSGGGRGFRVRVTAGVDGTEPYASTATSLAKPCYP